MANISIALSLLKGDLGFFGTDIDEDVDEYLNQKVESAKSELSTICRLNLDENDVWDADLIAMYRLLPEEQREDIFDLVHLKYRKHVERKKESIYWTYHNGSSATKSGPAEDAEAQGGTA